MDNVIEFHAACCLCPACLDDASERIAERVEANQDLYMSDDGPVAFLWEATVAELAHSILPRLPVETFTEIFPIVYKQAYCSENYVAEPWEMRREVVGNRDMSRRAITEAVYFVAAFHDPKNEVSDPFGGEL